MPRRTTILTYTRWGISKILCQILNFLIVLKFRSYLKSKRDNKIVWCRYSYIISRLVSVISSIFVLLRPIELLLAHLITVFIKFKIVHFFRGIITKSIGTSITLFGYIILHDTLYIHRIIWNVSRIHAYNRNIYFCDNNLVVWHLFFVQSFIEINICLSSK